MEKGEMIKRVAAQNKNVELVKFEGLACLIYSVSRNKTFHTKMFALIVK